MSALSKLAERKDLSLNCQVVVPLSKLPNFTSQRRYVRTLFDGCMWLEVKAFLALQAKWSKNIVRCVIFNVFNILPLF